MIRLNTSSEVLAVFISVSNSKVRLTRKQWEHIITARSQLKNFQRQIIETVERPDEVYAPPPRVEAQFHAVKRFRELVDFGLSENLVVVYRELGSKEGFIITAFPISVRRKDKRYRRWRRIYP